MAEDKLVLELLKQQLSILESIRMMVAAIGIAVLWQWIRGDKKK